MHGLIDANLARVNWAAKMSMAEAVPIPMFVLMWTAMMAAMMLPSVAPVALMWVRSIGSSSTKANRLGRNLLFISGYLGVWGSLGLVAYAGGLGMSMLSNAYPQRSKWIVAGLFLTSGIYQLTPFKNACLRHCRSPMSQLMGYAALKGAWRDLRVGLHHGLYCVGCCWGIMLVLIVVGTMNLLAAAGLAVVIFLEKSWTRGPLIAKMFGLALIGLGIVTLFTPMTALQFAMSL